MFYCDMSYLPKLCKTSALYLALTGNRCCQDALAAGSVGSLAWWNLPRSLTPGEHHHFYLCESVETKQTMTLSYDR